MSTNTSPPKPPRNNAAPEPQVFPPSEPDDFGPIIELGPLEPQTPAQKLQTIASFNPNETLAEQILTDASNPRVSLHIIAEKAHTTIEALQAWLARPEIAERLDNIIQSIRQRSRLKITCELDNITEACATILERFHRAPDRGATEDRRPDTELRASHIITRNASNALMASRVMLALAKYLDGPPKPQRRAPAHSDPLPTPNPNPNRPASAPAPALDPALRLTPGELNKAFRLLPSLASVDLHDFREYLTSNHHSNGHTVEELTHTGNVPRDVAVGGAPQQPVPAAGNPTTSSSPVPPVRRCSERQPAPTTLDSTTSPDLATTPLEPEGLARNGRGQSEVGRRPTSAAHGNSPDDSPHPAGVQQKPPENSIPAPTSTTPPHPCTCGPTPCPTCPSTPTLLTIAGTNIPRARDPTARPR
jgi:hypothetical protein